MKKPLKSVIGALLATVSMMVLGCSHTDTPPNLANTPNPGGSPANAAAPTPNAPQSAEDKMPRVSVEAAQKMLADGEAIIIDVRGTDAFNTTHVKGALDYPLAKMEAGDFKGLPKDKKIIAYCT